MTILFDCSAWQKENAISASRDDNACNETTDQKFSHERVLKPVAYQLLRVCPIHEYCHRPHLHYLS